MDKLEAVRRPWRVTCAPSLTPDLLQMKQQLAGNEAVVDDDAAAVYVRNFGVALFQAADNDDRAGKATR